MTQQLPGSGQIWTPPTSGTIPSAPIPQTNPGADWTQAQQAYLDALVLGLKTVIIVTGNGTVLSGAQGMQDADFAVTAAMGSKVYVGAEVAFTVTRNFILPANPAPGTTITWADEVTGSSALSVGKNLVAQTVDGTQIQAGVAGQTGGTNLAATYTATSAAWGPGSTITFFFNGTFWKVI